ncbi:MAG: hypothetical protein A2Z14_19910 [Chloroflexi bacterium RBG_16_48_8]|nr:MAG: hypothetical protein A2Z14_19910 [Chloroflexi bacterium RBG_16_48_8]
MLGGGVKQNNYNPLRINVGFLLYESVGTSRKFEFDEPAVQIGDDLDIFDLQGSVTFTRTAQGLYAHGTLSASTPLECVRCLSDFQQALSIEISELFEYPPKKETDPILAILETGILDLTGLCRELMLLELPIQSICSQDCQGLCPICGNPLNEGQCEHPEANIDPRLAVLRTLLKES